MILLFIHMLFWKHVVFFNENFKDVYCNLYMYNMFYTFYTLFKKKKLTNISSSSISDLSETDNFELRQNGKIKYLICCITKISITFILHLR